MQTLKSSILTLLFTMILTFAGNITINATEKEFKAGDWNVKVTEKGGITAMYKGNPVLENSIAEFVIDGDTLNLSNCRNLKISSEDKNGILGKTRQISICGKIKDIEAEQFVNLYPDKDFLTAELILKSTAGLASNYIAPVSITENYELFKKPGNHIVFVPYDNDAWVRYSISSFGEKSPESYEVSAIFNADTREGLILGSLEHDTWKTGVKAVSDNTTGIDTLKVYGGIATNLTRDIIPHGKVKGKSVKSPLVFIGRVDDWRDGMEEFADMCNIIAPQIESRGPRPFGWNSWGKLQTKINYDKAMEVSDFIKSEIQDNSFNNDGVVYIGLDAFWDYGFRPEQHKEFVAHCKANGQKAGIYHCPFTDWGKNPEAIVGEFPEYKFKDLYLYGDGKILEFDGAYALDPTHPAVKARIKKQLDQFKDWGYEFVKIDFMAHGAYESDSHYNPEVTTGVQAFNEGMAFIDSVADGKLWINLSIAPLFPTNYAHSRRIGCDAWADINNTEYTLNALTYGWWLDHLYHFNDADHMVLEGVTDGENRARVTSSAITGVYFLGDDMSLGGDDRVKERIKKTMTNPGINQMARECKSFRPVEFGKGDRAADAFCYSTPEVLYVAMFNFDENSKEKRIPLHRLGLSEGKNYKCVELWSDNDMNLYDNIDIEIPGKDVKVLKINLN